MSIVRVMVGMGLILCVCLPISSMATKSIKSLPIEFANPDSVSFDKALDLNKASVEELSRLKGMSPSLARSVVQYRTQNGQFRSFYELSRVDGLKALGSRKLKKIEGQLKIG